MIGHERTPCPEFPYIGERICFRKQSSAEQYRARVTSNSNSNGKTEWFDLRNSYAEYHRSGWEVVSIKNKDDTDRRSFSVNARHHTIYIIVKSLADYEVFYVKKPAGFAYEGECIYIRRGGEQKYLATVSSKSNPATSDWPNLPSTFDDTHKWVRHTWASVYIRNTADSDRRAFYVNAKNHTVYITVRSLDDIEVVSVKNPKN